MKRTFIAPNIEAANHYVRRFNNPQVTKIGEEPQVNKSSIVGYKLVLDDESMTYDSFVLDVAKNPRVWEPYSMNRKLPSMDALEREIELGNLVETAED